ncbi:hypothetical protein K435DRAFT_649064, partial [Dendrothele bispora CBS 962.96]
GPPIPRQDRENILECYHRLMLILFKPWRCIDDLRIKDQSWKDAFETFLPECPSEFKEIMDNMQLQHECRDSRDDYFDS